MLNTRLAPSFALLLSALILGCAPAEREQAASETTQETPELQAAAMAMPDRYGAAVPVVHRFPVPSAAT